MNQLEVERHQELATFLRSRRARISPEAVGLPRGARRRTPGLRREEVAVLAGVSPEWYTWLEQGRDINVSMQVLDSLARVLRLDGNERDHLFLLALRQTPPVDTFVPPTVTPALHQFLHHLGSSPACITDLRLNILARNDAHCIIFDDYGLDSERSRNLIWRLFALPASRYDKKEWEHLVRAYLGQFRTGYGRFIDDPWWADIIAELSEVSPAFRELWAEQEVATVSEGRKNIHHPLVGDLCFDFLWLQTVDSADLRVLIHTPVPHSGTAEKIARLLES